MPSHILPKTHNSLIKAPKTFCDLCIGYWRYYRLLETDGDELAADDAAGRQRSSLSCEAIELGAPGALSSAITDVIFELGETYILFDDLLLDRVIKCARAAPLNYKPPQLRKLAGATSALPHPVTKAECATFFGCVRDIWLLGDLDGATVDHICR